MKITFSKTRTKLAAYERDWGRLPAPVVANSGKNLCAVVVESLFVLVGSGYVMVGSGRREAGGEEEEEQLRQKSNNPNLKGGERSSKIIKHVT